MSKIRVRRLLQAELQADLDAWLETYNTTRPHQGYRTRDRTPLLRKINLSPISKQVSK